jgi:MbtH protein
VRDDEQDDRTYKVVVNHEEQYSIWPAERENAPGWRDAGQTGTKGECLAYIERVWTDMRPLSLRRRMDKTEAGGNPSAPSEPSDLEADS